MSRLLGKALQVPQDLVLGLSLASCHFLCSQNLCYSHTNLPANNTPFLAHRLLGDMLKSHSFRWEKVNLQQELLNYCDWTSRGQERPQMYWTASEMSSRS